MIGRCVLMVGALALMILVNVKQIVADDVTTQDQESKRSATSFEVGVRIIARWKNNHYYPGKIASIRDDKIDIQFDDGDKITHSNQDVSAVILDQKPYHVHLGQHVLAKKGNFKVGFVSGKDASKGWKVTFDGLNGEGFYDGTKLRELPESYSPHEEGSRVFARWTNGLYYNGFVTSSNEATVSILYDDGDKITLKKSDKKAVILDQLPCYHDILIGTRVIGFWPGRKRFYPGVVTSKKNSGSGSCLQNGAYHVNFDDGDKRVEDFYQLRLIP